MVSLVKMEPIDDAVPPCPALSSGAVPAVKLLVRRARSGLTRVDLGVDLALQILLWKCQSNPEYYYSNHNLALYDNLL
jgi:hypothetical protein